MLFIPPVLCQAKSGAFLLESVALNPENMIPYLTEKSDQNLLFLPNFSLNDILLFKKGHNVFIISL